MVLQVTVFVGHKNREDNAPLKLIQILNWLARNLPDYISNVRVIIPFLALPIKRGARRHLRDARLVPPTKSTNECNWTVATRQFKLRCRNPHCAASFNIAKHAFNPHL